MRTHPMPEARRPAGRALPLLLAYPLLALAGAITHRQGLSLAALVLLSGLLLWPALRRRHPAAWLLWLGLLAAMAWLAARALAGLLLDAVPLLVNLLLAWLFGRTLRAGRQPLVARIIEAIEGASRLAQPGVARYARRLTLFWTLLLAGQATLLAVLAACQAPGGVLDRLGVASPWPVSPAWVHGYMHGGVYLVLAATFVLEYLFRRWHLRHLPHLGLPALLHRLVLGWPRIVRGGHLDDMTDDAYRTTLRFAADHPSLPGHFPGRPLVAGVLLLERVAEALRAWRGQRLARVREAKFVAPLQPGQDAELRLTSAGAQVRFEIRRDGILLARGLVEGATDA